MAFEFKTSGIEATLEFFKKHQATVSRWEDSIMKEFADRIFERSQELVPVRDETRPDKPPPSGRPHKIPGGSLKASGRVFHGETRGEWIIGYGGGMEGDMTRPAPYAVYVHEIEQIHLGEGSVRYLARAVDEIYPDLVAEIGPLIQSKFFGVGLEGERYVPQRGDLERTDIGGEVQTEQYRLRPNPTIVEGGMEE